MFGEIGFYLSSPSNRAKVADLLGEHVYLAIVPVLAGIMIAVPLGSAARSRRVVRNAVQGAANVLYTVPSLALFVAMPGILGTGILDPLNVVVALTVYTAALLIRPVMDALDAVPLHVVAAATAMGYRPARRFAAVELPLAVPVLIAGVRVATVSNISLVSVGALIGVGGLGQLFTEGFQTRYEAPILIGIVLTLVLALIVDVLLLVVRRSLTPWTRLGVGAVS
jgi:osmoprotectant transport system permease protein